MRLSNHPSVYFQIWDAETLLYDALAANLGEAKTVFNRYKIDYPNSKLKAYHLVRANV